MIRLPYPNIYKKIYTSILFIGTLAIVNILVIYKEAFHPLIGIINLLYFLLVPGFLLTRLMKIKGKPGELFGYSAILSVSYLIFFGFLTNNIIPMFGITQPLSLIPFLISFNIALITIYYIVMLYGDLTDRIFRKPDIKPLSFTFSFITFLFPVIMSTGSNLLNNGGSNIFNLIGLFGISLHLLILLLIRKHLQNFVFPLCIYLIGLSLLLMYSIRTPNLMGWDIQTEYKVFQITKSQFEWTVLNYHNAYNATLGITILPTLISHLTILKDLYVFKLIYLFIFAFSGVGAYYIFQRYVSRTAAYISSFFVIIQMSYTSMPSLARQEIAYLAFVYIILILFDKVNRKSTKNALFLLLSATIVVSHYTTTYITIGLFVTTYLVSKMQVLINKIIHKIKPDKKIIELKLQLNGLNILFMIVITVLWYGVYTNASANLKNLFTSVNQSIGKIHTQESRSKQSWITVTGKNEASTYNDFESFIKINSRSNNPSYYRDEITNQYPVYRVAEDYIPYNKTTKQIPELISLIDRHLMKVFIIFGIVTSIFLFIKRRTKLSYEYLLFSSIYFTLIVAAIFIPQVSKQYNMERLYQQGLIFLGIFPVILFLYIFPRIYRTIKYLILGIFFIIYLYSYHGIITQFFGGLPTLNLNNNGNEYSQYYIHDSELSAAKWLDKNRNKDIFVHASMYSELRLSSNSNFDNLQKNLFPSAIRKYSYVYGSYENVQLSRVQTKFGNKHLLYNFPHDFLNDNKDVIYSNKYNEIYR